AGQRVRRRLERTSRRDPARHRACACGGRSRAAARTEEGRLSHPRSAYEGAEEVRSEEGPPCASVLEAVTRRRARGKITDTTAMRGHPCVVCGGGPFSCRPGAPA